MQTSNVKNILKPLGINLIQRNTKPSSFMSYKRPILTKNAHGKELKYIINVLHVNIYRYTKFTIVLSVLFQNEFNQLKFKNIYAYYIIM